MVLESKSEKTVLDDLKPVVLAFDRLLPMTVMACESTLRPLTPLYNALDIPIIIFLLIPAGIQLTGFSSVVNVPMSLLICTDYYRSWYSITRGIRDAQNVTQGNVTCLGIENSRSRSAAVQFNPCDS